MNHEREIRFSAAHRRYLVLEQGVGAAVVNFAINLAIAWAMFRSMATVPLWGEQSIAGDTIGTCFLLPFITCLIVTPLARRQVRDGKLPPVAPGLVFPILDRLPKTTLRRGFVFGAVCVLVAVPLTVLFLSAVGIDAMSFSRFLAFKASFAAGLAAVVTPMISLRALADVGPAA